MLNSRRISKLLSLMLRHRPGEFDLEMDAYGFVPLDEVIRAVQNRYSEVEEEDVRELVEDSEQRRFEITEKGIRALYGHSISLELDGDPVAPPDRLYLWCSAKEARRYRSEGVKSIDRFYVHLSLSREEAEVRSDQVGAPCVVEILAREAHAGGIEFYPRGEVVLSRKIPPEFVGEISGLEEGAEKGEVRSESPGPVSFGRRLRRDTRNR